MLRESSASTAIALGAHAHWLPTHGCRNRPVTTKDAVPKARPIPMSSVIENCELGRLHRIMSIQKYAPENPWKITTMANFTACPRGTCSTLSESETRTKARTTVKNSRKYGLEKMMILQDFVAPQSLVVHHLILSVDADHNIILVGAFWSRFCRTQFVNGFRERAGKDLR